MLVYATIDRDYYEILMRSSTIVRILRNNREVQYDDLDLTTRESLLIEIIKQLTMYAQT